MLGLNPPFRLEMELPRKSTSAKHGFYAVGIVIVRLRRLVHLLEDSSFS